MRCSRLALATAALAALCLTAGAQAPRDKQPEGLPASDKQPAAAKAKDRQPAAAKEKDKQPDNKLPFTKLAPAKVKPNLCVLKYRISTASPECQAHFDQALGYFYSYVWMEAARSFETAARHDPECAMAWWGLSRALDRWSKPNHTDALKKAQELMPGASPRERMLIKARLEEKGMLPGAKDAAGQEGRVKAAVATIDELIALFPDDEEGWYYRAQLAGGAGLFGGRASSAPFYHALLRINPLHPGANHELVHFYENFKRPALGWPFAQKYIESSPGLPHAFHMQAHLGTRIGKWDRTTDWSSHAIVLQKAYHKEMDVHPSQDQQFAHHLETLMVSLTHDGRFEEARKLKTECEGYKIEHRMPWFRLHVAERNWEQALQMANKSRRGDKVSGSYMRALVYLKKGEVDRAAPEVAVLEEAYRKRRDKKLEAELWEVQGLLLCARGQDAGLKLLAKLVDQAKNNYGAHAWGHGAYHMENWGVAALQCGKWDVAEEAFLEAVAHDPGSVRGALGMQVVCERQGRNTEAMRFAELAQRCWRRAPVESLLAELAAMRACSSSAPSSPTPSVPLQPGAGK